MINEQFLVNSAKAFNGESYSVPSYFLVSTSTASVSAASTSISEEIGSREALTSSRVTNVVTYNNIRAGASVIASTGNDIRTIALMTASTNGSVMTSLNVGGIVQTTAFDIDFDWSIRYKR